MARPCVPDAATEANEQIRQFMAARTGRPLWAEEAAEYERLLAAWAAAVGDGPTSSTYASTIS